MKNSILRLFAILFLISFAISSTTSAAELKTYRDDTNHFSIKLLNRTSTFPTSEIDADGGLGIKLFAAKKGGILSHSNIPVTLVSILGGFQIEKTSDEQLNQFATKYDEIWSGSSVAGFDVIRTEKKEIFKMQQSNALFVKVLGAIKDDKKNHFAYMYHFLFIQNYKLYQILYIIPAENDPKLESQVIESAQSFTIDRYGKN